MTTDRDTATTPPDVLTPRVYAASGLTVKAVVGLGVLALALVALVGFDENDENDENDDSVLGWPGPSALSLLSIAGVLAAVLTVLYLRGRRGIVLGDGFVGSIPIWPGRSAHFTQIEDFVGVTADEYLDYHQGVRAALTLWRPATRRVAWSRRSGSVGGSTTMACTYFVGGVKSMARWSRSVSFPVGSTRPGKTGS